MSGGGGIRLRKLSPIIRVLTTYVISSFGLTILAFYVVFPQTSKLLEQTTVNPQSSLYKLLSFLPQYAIYGLVTALFYFLVARPLKIRPVFGEAKGYKRMVTLCLCIGITYVFVSPFDTIFTAINGIGILTYLITGLSEEWVYRGVLTRVFKENLSLIWAIVISSVLFALSHWAEVIFVDGQLPFSKGDFISLGQDLLFGLVFGVMAWRSRSIIWVAFLHCMADWQPYREPGRQWMLDFHFPWLQLGYLQIYVIGLIGAEVIGFFTKSKLRDIRRSDIADVL